MNVASNGGQFAFGQSQSQPSSQAQSQPQANTSFAPIMSPAQIVEALNSDRLGLGLALDEDDVGRPSPASVQTVYAAFLQSFSGLAPEQTTGPRTALLAHSTYPHAPELFHDAVGLLIFYWHIRWLVTATGNHKFTVSDLTRPDPARTRKFYSILLNLAIHANHNRPFVQRTLSSALNVHADKDVLQSKLTQVRADIDAINQRRSQQAAQIDDVRSQQAAVTTALQQSQERSQQIANELSNIKSQKEVENNELKKVAADHDKVTEEIARLRSQVISSPVRQRREVGEMSTNIAAEKTKEAEMDAKLRKLRERITALEGYKQDIKNALNALHDIDTQKRKVDASSALAAQQQAGIEKRKLEMQELENVHQRTVNAIASLEEKLVRIRDTAEAKRLEVGRRMQLFNEEHQQILKDRQVKSKEVEAIRRETANIENTIRTLNRHADKHKLEMAEVWHQVDRHALEYEQAIQNYMSLPGPLA